MQSASVDLICIDPKQISAFWPFARHFIKAAIDYTGLSDFALVEREVLEGKQLLWLAFNGERIEAAATTQLVGDNCRPICVITACGGHQRERWLPLHDKIVDYARAEGCRAMRIIGRKGWERVLQGYHAEYVILEKALD